MTSHRQDAALRVSEGEALDGSFMIPYGQNPV